MGLLVQTLAADEKYPVLKRENLTTPIQMQLSQKENTFPQFLAAFLKSNLYLEYFQKKKIITLIDFAFPKLRTRKPSQINV